VSIKGRKRQIEDQYNNNPAYKAAKEREMLRLNNPSEYENYYKQEYLKSPSLVDDKTKALKENMRNFNIKNTRGGTYNPELVMDKTLGQGSSNFTDRAEQGMQDQMSKLEMERDREINNEKEMFEGKYGDFADKLKFRLGMGQNKAGIENDMLQKLLSSKLEKNAINSNLMREGLDYAGNYDDEKRIKQLRKKLFDEINDSNDGMANVLNNLEADNSLNPSLKVKDIKNKQKKLFDLLTSNSK
jgi:hypothetical protein